MQKLYPSAFKIALLTSAVILFSVQAGRSQATYAPYSYQFDQNFNAARYSIKNSVHTALKPFIVDSTLAPEYNAMMNRGVDSSRRGWILRKIFNEHLFDVRKKDYTFYADYLPDLQLGRDINNKINTNLNTRGYQLGGSIGSKFFFYSSGYEDQGVFPAYLNNYINKIDFVPGEAYDRSFGKSTKDWSYVTAIVSYTPIKQLNITLGEDKNFIGDGYRSLLLSDFAAPYPFLRLTATVGKVQYMLMWTNMEDLFAPKFDTFGNNRRKWVLFHYLDWTVSNRVSFGFFNALIAQDASDTGVPHGFDVNYINPVIFASTLGPSKPVPDNVLMGFTAKYKILNKTAIYGQVLLDKVNSSSTGGTNAGNTGGVQLGFRGSDLFKIKKFNYLFEFNTVKPYTYSNGALLTNYTDYSQPLGDPLGANFNEFIGILNYSIGQFDFMGHLSYAKYTYDPGFLSSETSTSTTGAAINSTLYYGEGTVSYLINPKYNLRFELGGLVRDEKNDLGSKKTAVITFGLRSTFRDLYHDF